MIVGLTGLSGSGKDTVANWLVENNGFERKAFADPLRNLLYHMNPNVKTRENVSLPLKEIISNEGSWHRAQLVHPEVRRLLQTFATEFIRNTVDKDFWVKLTMYDLDWNVNYVFSDVRFPNELDALKKVGGVIVNVKSDRAESTKMEHISENNLLKHDIQIVNDGTLTEFIETIGNVFKFVDIV